MGKKYDFGDYVYIEQKRHGVENEKYLYKVIKAGIRSNYYVKAPVQIPAKQEKGHELEDVVLCVCCGIDETQVLPFRVKDLVPLELSKKDKIIQKIKNMKDKEVDKIYPNFCEHPSFSKKYNSAKCNDCGSYMGHFCKSSPDNLCYYFSEEAEAKLFVTLHNGSRHSLPKDHDVEGESDDWCIFCGEPEDRK